MEFLRDARWLNTERVRAYAVMFGIASLALLVVSWHNAMGAQGTDFLAFWGAGKAVLAGHPAAAYDTAFHAGWQTANGAHAPFDFVNPPPFLFAVVPFALLPLQLAWLLWVAFTYALWAWASVRTFPRLWQIILIWPGALLAAGHAQNGLLTGALLVGAVALLDRRPVLSGALIGALIIKPHLALLMPFWLAAGGRWKAFLSAGASTIAFLLASWALFGTNTMLAYPSSWDISAALMSQQGTDFFLRMSTLYSQLHIYAGDTVALAVQAVLTFSLIGLVCMSWKRFGQDAMATGALALAATSVATPYLFNYDLPMLSLPTLWLVQEGLDRGFRPWEKLALVALWFAPYVTRAIAFPLEINLMPLAAVGMIALIWTRATVRSAAGIDLGQG
jgi:hypothetical protein